jgi:pyruvate/2-oxoglutarate dehydrogenase complex dihydrolipoamide dehydrogenase (E3) component
MDEGAYDLAIIGAGSTGLIAADFAVKLGARVALLERSRIGGDCTWTGCVPSKSLLKVARVAHEMRSASRFGVQSHNPVVDMNQVREYLRSTIHQIYQPTTPEALRAKGMEVHLGPVQFTDPHTLLVGDARLTAKKILIATGARPAVPSIAGLSDVKFSTYLDIFENDRLPATMVVVGGGPVGAELAQAYSRLGCRVTIFAEQLLAKEESEASEIVRQVFEREGIQIIGEKALSVSNGEGGISVQSSNHRQTCDLLFVATGRTPTLDGLNLEAAGVRFTEKGIEVNEELQTSTRHIYAAGDVIGGMQFSHLAGWQGFQAVRNALLPGSSAGFSKAVPRVTFCDPEVAQVGQTEEEALKTHPDDVTVLTWPISRVDRAVCDGDQDGLMKLVTTKAGIVLGATIVGHRAGDAITELAMAMHHNLKVSDIASTIHPYPTYSTGIQLMATEMSVEHALEGFSGKLLRAASHFAL